MKIINNYLKKYDDIKNFINTDGDFSVVNDESNAFLLSMKFINNPQTTIIILNNLHSAQKLYNCMSTILKDDCLLYCVDEISKFTSLATSPEMNASRLYVLNKLINKEKVVVITHSLATKRYLPKKEVFLNKMIKLTMNQNINKKQLIEKLVQIGYKNVLQVTQTFEFSMRGGVIDIFSLNYKHPLRIEFFDDLIESLRFFDEGNQRTISTINECIIIPATEFLFNNLDKGLDNINTLLEKQMMVASNNIALEENVKNDIFKIMNCDFDESIYKYLELFEDYGSFFDYLSDYKCYIVDIESVKSSADFNDKEIYENFNEMFERGKSLTGLSLMYPIEIVLTKINFYKISTLLSNENLFTFRKINCFEFNYNLLYSELESYVENGYTVYIGLGNKVHYDSLILYLQGRNLTYKAVSVDDKLIKGLNIGMVDYGIGLDLDKYKIAILGENEIFKKKIRIDNQFAKFKNAITIESVNEIAIGDYLVHEQHGIGRYVGIETLLNNDVHRDYLHIEYKDNGILYVPLEQFKMIRKFVSKEGVVPKLNKLGSKEWEKTKKRIKERVSELAEQLIKLYSLRVEKKGFAHLPDDYLMTAFENDFPYELTRDQLSSLNEIKKDMERPVIMDRLLCGDVGFGKTEVAFRAAFKAICSGKQVALLCPTTLLCRQHYMTAISRFKNYDLNIKMLSRLVSDHDQEITLKQLKENKVNLIIGTHRLLSSDVKFADLGLLIVDEEHKFGVVHKEKIKVIKETVDVLTLSATPIPRTLQMALTGVRSFSTITTPIDNRMPVQTYVIEKDKYSIKEIIERELARGGQVYYLHNRVDSLPTVARELKSIIKNARIGIAHGKLTKDQMEDIMQSFINKEYDILLCTTIIENGIDISNVNTILIDNADRFGLSQLYQIKGRVGRSDRLAYAYLMYKTEKELSEIAKKRLQTIKEFASLGSGYKIAMRDLITRGAGDLLGAEQSGFIDSVGMDMYIEMLNEAISKKRANIEDEEEIIKPNKTLNIDAYIPQEFFNNDYEKIQLYKDIDKVKNIDELNKLKDEIVDKAGKLPESILMLFEKKTIDIFEQEEIINDYIEYEDYILIKLSEEFSSLRGVGVDIFELANSISSDINLRFPNMKIQAHIKKTAGWLFNVSKFVKGLADIKKKYGEQNGNNFS